MRSLSRMREIATSVATRPNMKDSLYRLRLRANREIKGLLRWPFRQRLSPFAANENPVIIHRCYHKVGTVWFGRILMDVASHYQMRFRSSLKKANIKKLEQSRNAGVFLDIGTHVQLEKIRPYVGSHMIRDPRDMVISAYHYHKWTKENWANIPRQQYGGLSYREYLNTLDRDDGLLEEINNSAGWIRHMAEWRFDDPRILELKYEDVLANERESFARLYAHYGFREEAIETAVSLSMKYSIQAFSSRGGVGQGSHLRSGRSREWDTAFNQEHRRVFKEMFPGVPQLLGYESDDSW